MDIVRPKCCWWFYLRKVTVSNYYNSVTRYCNLTPTGIPHATPEDLVFRGYTIPASALVMADFDSVFMDPEIWTDPEVFRPDRFIDEKGNIENREEFLAFFTGKNDKDKMSVSQEA